MYHHWIQLFTYVKCLFKSKLERVRGWSGGRLSGWEDEGEGGCEFGVSLSFYSESLNIYILLTDGSQTDISGAEDPAKIADELRREGVLVIVVGMGTNVNRHELEKIAGGRDKLFSVSSFQDLLQEKFMKFVAGEACRGRFKASIIIATR